MTKDQSPKFTNTVHEGQYKTKPKRTSKNGQNN